MSYNNVMGGKLKIKGGIPSSSTGVKKKTKKREEKQKEETAEKIAQDVAVEEEIVAPAPKPVRNKTAAELAFERAQKKREEERIKKSAAIPYREKVDQLNKYLGGLSEHYDIPKVGPG